MDISPLLKMWEYNQKNKITKQCIECKKNKVAYLRYWHINIEKEYYLEDVCIECEKKSRRRKKK